MGEGSNFVKKKSKLFAKGQKQFKEELFKASRERKRIKRRRIRKGHEL